METLSFKALTPETLVKAVTLKPQRVAAMLLCRLRPAALGRRDVSQQLEVKDAVAEMLLRSGG